jgi:hypothetical protein
LSPVAAELDAELRRLHVTSVHAFMAESPTIMLVVYEFPHQDILLGAKDQILARQPSPGAFEVRVPPPFHAAAAWTGAWLLLAGFPAEKPPSPDMEKVRGAFLQAWFGEE